MKNLFKTTIALGALSILEMNQPATAVFSDDPSFHLARGRGGERREAPREELGEQHREGPRNEGSAAEHTEHPAVSGDHPASGEAERRLHGINEGETSRNHELLKGEGWFEEGGEGWVEESPCPNGVDANGNCIQNNNTEE